MNISQNLKEFISTEKAGGFILIFCSIVSLILANTSFGISYIALWNFKIGEVSLNHVINDGLMAIFFLLISLELKREFVSGQFSNIKNALLPVFAALGGMLIPASFYLLFNYGTITQAGAGIPMATDAAFALAILSLMGNRVPLSLKLLLIAIAVIDDLFAIIIIAVFYTQSLDLFYALLALGVFSFLLILNRIKITNIGIYLIGGVVMWYFMLHSGIHSTISGVLLAFAIPYFQNTPKCPATVLQHYLHFPVSFLILPLFALANTCIEIQGDFLASITDVNGIGILCGLVIGKPLGIFLFSFVAVKAGVGKLSNELKWEHIIGIGFLAGVGFTIAIFISILAFEDSNLVENSKVAVLCATLISTLVTYSYFKLVAGKSK